MEEQRINENEKEEEKKEYKNENEEKNEEEKTQQKVNEKEEEEKEIEKKYEIEKTQQKINEKEEENLIKSELEKCLYSTAESLKMNLCIKCNNDLGYYPVYFNDNFFPNNFVECFNEDTKLSNFYFNKGEKKYKPCFETCNTCDYGGNEEKNNCTSCDINSIFRPEINDTTNCVKKCKYKYYITSYGQYKCTKDDQCPIEANLFIRKKNKCLENCKLDNINTNIMVNVYIYVQTIPKRKIIFAKI